jgi:hypothetical protein
VLTVVDAEPAAHDREEVILDRPFRDDEIAGGGFDFSRSAATAARTRPGTSAKGDALQAMTRSIVTMSP